MYILSLGGHCAALANSYPPVNVANAAANHSAQAVSVPFHIQKGFCRVELLHLREQRRVCV
jgi:hypothetical protein